MQVRTGRATGAAATFSFSLDRVARAAQYPGWGSTSWVYSSTREHCAAAIEIAADDSAQACIIGGGVPRPFAGA